MGAHLDGPGRPAAPQRCAASPRRSGTNQGRRSTLPSRSETHPDHLGWCDTQSPVDGSASRRPWPPRSSSTTRCIASSLRNDPRRRSTPPARSETHSPHLGWSGRVSPVDGSASRRPWAAPQLLNDAASVRLARPYAPAVEIEAVEESVFVVVDVVGACVVGRFGAGADRGCRHVGVGRRGARSVLRGWGRRGSARGRRLGPNRPRRKPRDRRSIRRRGRRGPNRRGIALGP